MLQHGLRVSAPPHGAHAAAAFRTVWLGCVRRQAVAAVCPPALASSLPRPCAGSVLPGAHNAALQAGQLLAADALQLGGLGVEALLKQFQPLPARVGVLAAARHVDVAALDRDGILRGGGRCSVSKIRQQ